MLVPVLREVVTTHREGWKQNQPTQTHDNYWFDTMLCILTAGWIKLLLFLLLFWGFIYHSERPWFCCSRCKNYACVFWKGRRFTFLALSDNISTRLVALSCLHVGPAAICPHWDNPSRLQSGPLCTPELLQRVLTDAKIMVKLENSLSILASETLQLSQTVCLGILVAYSGSLGIAWTF